MDGMLHNQLLPGQYRLRAPALADAPAVTGLINLCAMVQTGGLHMTVRQVVDIWTAPGFDLGRDAWLVEAAPGHPVGYAELWEHPAGEALPYVWLHVAPGSDATAIGARLLQAAEARALQEAACATGRIALRTATVSFNQAARRLLACQGYHLAQRLWQSPAVEGHAAEPHVADCIVCRAYVPGADAPTLYRYDIFEKELRAEVA